MSLIIQGNRVIHKSNENSLGFGTGLLLGYVDDNNSKVGLDNSQVIAEVLFDKPINGQRYRKILSSSISLTDNQWQGINNNDDWNLFIEFLKLIFNKYDENCQVLQNPQMDLVAFYSFYHYFNADVTKIEELMSGMVDNQGANMSITAIFASLVDEESVDFLTTMSKEYYYGVFLNHPEEKLANLAKKMAYTIVQAPYIDNENAIERYVSLNCELSDSNTYTNRIICDFDVPVEEKIRIQRMVSEYSVKKDNVCFEILFRDDIQSEINDIENPKEYVDNGQLVLYNPKSICYFGDERSFLTMISAKSLKQVFYDYGNKGLLDSNLRFFVSSKKIDPKIIYTIQNEPDNFAYYNNGIIITCEDYCITNEQLSLKNFSIVNGGQTTNLIGRTDFDRDFPVICKVIKNKYESIENRVAFLSKVAEASNTQKPINAKDLIANKKEQRLLKLQFERAGIFLRVKRGEKIDKSRYSASWQNASNDEVAQFIYSIVFQCPGSAKNSKSKLLDTERIYQTIFDSSYTDGFFVSIQHLKVAYSEWLKRLKKSESKSSTKLALAKNALLLTLASFGLLYKVAVNNELKEYLLSGISISNDNLQLKTRIQQNDIGQTNLFTKTTIDGRKWNQYYALFEQLFGVILVPAYNKFKSDNPTYAYSHFTKTDSHYYNYVVPRVISKISDYGFMNTILLGTEEHKISIDYEKINRDQELNGKPGLQIELMNLRKKIVSESGGDVSEIDVLTRFQLANIMKYKPRTIIELNSLCDMTIEQVGKYGEQILQVIEKYTNIENIVGEV